jgi:hypothetical protein
MREGCCSEEDMVVSVVGWFWVGESSIRAWVRDVLIWEEVWCKVVGGCMYLVYGFEITM